MVEPVTYVQYFWMEWAITGNTGRWRVRHISGVVREMTFELIFDETRLLSLKWLCLKQYYPPTAWPLKASLVIYCEIARDSKWHTGEWVLLIRAAFKLYWAFFTRLVKCVENQCAVGHALIEVTGSRSSACFRKDVLGDRTRNERKKKKKTLNRIKMCHVL